MSAIEAIYVLSAAGAGAFFGAGYLARALGRSPQEHAKAVPAPTPESAAPVVDALAETKLAELTAALQESQDRELHANTTADTLRKKGEDLAIQLTAAADQSRKLQADLDAAHAHLQTTQHKLEQLLNKPAPAPAAPPETGVLDKDRQAREKLVREAVVAGAELARLRADNKQLEDKLKELKSQEGDRSKAGEELTRIQSRIAGLESELKASQAETKQLRGEKQTLDQKVQRLTPVETQLRQARAEAESQVRRATGLESDLKKLKQSGQNEVNQLKGRIAELESAAAKAAALEKELRGVREELQKSSAGLQELAGLKARLVELESGATRVQELESELKAAREALQTKQEAPDGVEASKELEEARYQNEELQTRLESASSYVVRTKKEVSKLKAELDTLRAKATSADDDRTEIDRLREEVRNLREVGRQSSVQGQELASAREELSALRQKLGALESGAAEATRLAEENRILQQNQQAGRDTKELEAARQENASLRHKLQILEPRAADVDRLVEENRNLRDHLRESSPDSAVQDLAQAREEARTLRLKLQGMESKVADAGRLAEDNQALRDRVQELQADAKASEELELVKAKHKQALLDVDRLSRRATSLEEERIELVKATERLPELMVLETEARILRDRIRTLEGQLYSSGLTDPDTPPSSRRFELAASGTVEAALSILTRGPESSVAVLADSHGLLVAGAGEPANHDALAAMCGAAIYLTERAKDLLSTAEYQSVVLRDTNQVSLAFNMFSVESEPFTLASFGRRVPTSDEIGRTIAGIMGSMFRKQ